MPLFNFPPIDAANIASKLPEPLRQSAGAALQGLLGLFGADDPQTAMPVPPVLGMAKSPLGRRVTKSVADKLKQVTNPEALSEIERYGQLYSKAKKAGDDPALIKELGKRIAELHRIGTGGKAYTPSTNQLMSKSLADVFTGNEVHYKGIGRVSEVISGAREKAALEALKKVGKKR